MKTTYKKNNKGFISYWLVGFIILTMVIVAAILGAKYGILLPLGKNQLEPGKNLLPAKVTK